MLLLEPFCGVFVVNCAVLTYNAALNRPAYQSSVFTDIYGSYPAHLANDGNHGTAVRVNSIPQCAVSQLESNPWWAVDLGHPTAVYRVDLTNRDDGGMTNWKNGFWIYHFCQITENINMYFIELWRLLSPMSFSNGDAVAVVSNKRLFVFLWITQSKINRF